jgi:hypothetical protein
MIRSRHAAHARAAELRAVLEAETTERTVDAARRMVAERDRLRREVADLGKAIATAWESLATQEAQPAPRAISEAAS